MSLNDKIDLDKLQYCISKATLTRKILKHIKWNW